MGDRWFVVGEEGRRYSIVVRNLTNVRLEAVLSVDGLDVLDGRSASVRKRGYVIEPRRTLVVDGFRQSNDAVAAFRFSSVRESYAHEKYHNSRNAALSASPFLTSAAAIRGRTTKCGSGSERIRFPIVSPLRLTNSDRGGDSERGRFV